jgi:hypothetical protein
MSYLTLAKGVPDFSKMTLSMWFRVPKESIDKILSDPARPSEEHPLFRNWIPLLAFGKPPVDNGEVPQVDDIASGEAVVFDTVGFASDGEYDIDPFTIAVACDTYFDEPRARLIFNIQMGNKADGTNLYTAAAGAETIITEGMSDEELQEINTLLDTPGSGYGYDVGETHIIVVSGIADYTSDSLTRPERFYVETVYEIEPDKWHHLLLSLDVGSPVDVVAPPTEDHGNNYATSTYWSNGAEGVSGHAKLWYAIDDVDYRGRATPEEFEKWLSADPNQGFLHRLGPYSVDYGQYTEFVPGVSNPGDPTMNVPAMGDPNGILTQRGWEVAKTGSGLEYNLFVASDAYDYKPRSVPSSKEAFGIPASTKYVDHIYRVEMAEFQLFTGVTLDTGIVSNRRAFVDENGEPVLPKAPEGEKPPAEALLGKRPDILLHGSSDWEDGKNTGSLGVAIDDDGNANEIPEGQFVATGAIDPYKPDPSLHGEQSPSPAAMRRKVGPVRLTKKPAANARL